MQAEAVQGSPKAHPIPGHPHPSHSGQHWQSHKQYTGSALTSSTVALTLAERDFAGFDSQAVICRKPCSTTSYSDDYLLWADDHSS